MLACVKCGLILETTNENVEFLKNEPCPECSGLVVEFKDPTTEDVDTNGSEISNSLDEVEQGNTVRENDGIIMENLENETPNSEIINE